MAVGAIGGGLVAGIAFSKLMCMLLYAMIGYHAEIVFYVSESGVVSTILLFAGIFMLTFIYNLFRYSLPNRWNCCMEAARASGSRRRKS